MVVSTGSQINEYTVVKVIYSHDSLDIMDVVDGAQNLHVLKMYKGATHSQDYGLEEGSIKCFVWEGMKCVIQSDECLSKEDYFNLKDCDGSKKAGPVRKQSGGIVRTPMPCQQSSGDDEDDYDDDDDEDEDEDDDDDQFENEEDDEDDEEDEQESEDEGELSPVVHVIERGIGQKPRPILLHGPETSPRISSHVNIQSPVQKAFHSRHRDLPRTPMPDAVRTDNWNENERGVDQEKCRFQLKMISSSMLKRRGAKSMAM